MSTLQFSGHESFPCKQFWLKKGCDFVENKKKFTEESAVVHLGVGNNMVTSIRYWLKAFDLLDEKDKLTDIAEKIFGEKGWDPFLEDEGTLWLLHYLLNKKKRASIYSIVFTELRKQKPEFSFKHFDDYVSKTGNKFAERTLRGDFSVFTRTYLNDGTTNVEDNFSGLFADLNLLRVLKENRDEENHYYVIENRERPEIPSHIILYAILDNKHYGDSISFDNLYFDNDAIGSIFALNKEGLIEHLERIANMFKGKVVFKNDPLAREFQFKIKKPKAISILKNYYGS